MFLLKFIYKNLTFNVIYLFINIIALYFRKLQSSLYAFQRYKIYKFFYIFIKKKVQLSSI